MNRRAFVSLGAALAVRGLAQPARRTEIATEGAAFLINGRATYAGRSHKGTKIEGLLMNSRMVQGIFDDANPATRPRWKYPDTGQWDAERNTREFIAAMPEWRRHGLLSFTINLQGGSPEGYSKAQDWITGGIASGGSLVPAYTARLARILDKADELGMAPIVGVFYFGQDERVRDEAAVKRAVRETAEWLLGKGYRNVLLEINNECDVRYDHAILQPERVHELLDMVQSIRAGGRRLLAGVSYGGGRIPRPNVVKASDFLLLHGNGVKDPNRIAEMVRRTRQVDGYRPMPVLFNEDDHFDFDQPANNMMKAVSEYASWGYFDPGESNYKDGYQCPPVNWGINTERKRAFFRLLKEVTGA
jgi:hypothetical protein